jgi:hypothetical protein
MDLTAAPSETSARTASGDGFRLRLARRAVHGDVGTGLRKRQRNGAPDAARCAGDEGDAGGEGRRGHGVRFPFHAAVMVQPDYAGKRRLWPAVPAVGETRRGLTVRLPR